MIEIRIAEECIEVFALQGIVNRKFDLILPFNCFNIVEKVFIVTLFYIQQNIFFSINVSK